MKKIQREEVKTMYTDIYVSVDGKEFANEADCRAWECSYQGTIEASWKLIKKKEAYALDFGIPYAIEDYECYIIRPESLDEVVLINAYIESSTGGGRARLTTDHIGKLILLNFGYDHDWCDVYVLADHLKNIADQIAKAETEFPENN